MTNRQRDPNAVLRSIIWLEMAIVLFVFIFFPVFASGCGRPRHLTSRLNSAKQIAIAHLMYASDYERFCPAVVDNPESEPPTGTDYAASWMRCLEPYVKVKDIFGLRYDFQKTLTRSWGMPMRWRFYSGSDPSPTNMWRTPFGEAMMDGIGGYHRVGDSHYFGEAPAKFCGQRGGQLRSDVVPSYSETDILRPAETVLILDALSFEYGMTCRLRVPAPKDAADRASPYHGLNFAPRIERRLGFWYRSPVGVVAFADGHAKPMKVKQLFAIATDSSGAPYYKAQYVRE